MALDFMRPLTTILDSSVLTTQNLLDAEIAKRGNPFIKVVHATETMVRMSFKDVAGKTVTKMPIPVGIWEPISVTSIPSAIVKMDGTTDVASACVVFYGWN